MALISGLVSTYSAGALQVTVAKDFSVKYYDNYKVPSKRRCLCANPYFDKIAEYLQVVSNTLVNETYVLVQCGTSSPAADSLPLGAKTFQIPLVSVMAVDTVPLAFLVRLPSDYESLLEILQKLLNILRMHCCSLYT